MKLLNFEHKGSKLIYMNLSFIDRFNKDASSFLAITYTEKDSRIHDNDDDDEDDDSQDDKPKKKAEPGIFESAIDQNKVFTNVKLLLGKKLDQGVTLDRFINSFSDSEQTIELKGNCGVISNFVLH